MNTVMSLAVGLAIGYFVYQFVASGRRLRIRGQIHRSAVDRKIAGVCGGIAEYLGLNSTGVRILFVLSGVGILFYIVAAMIIPEA